MKELCRNLKEISIKFQRNQGLDPKILEIPTGTEPALNLRSLNPRPIYRPHISVSRRVKSVFSQSNFENLKIMLVIPQITVNLEDMYLWLFIGITVFNPFYWNIVARLEYKNHFLTRLFGTKELACYIFALTIFGLGLLRDYLFTVAIAQQPIYTTDYVGVRIFSVLISLLGSILVGSSMYMLGIHGTYLGDYFGIIKSERVTGFPFSTFEHPMYYGSTLCFLGTAVWNYSIVGCILSGWVLLVYMVFALWLEQPFTTMIYSNVGKSNGYTRVSTRMTRSTKKSK